MIVDHPELPETTRIGGEPWHFSSNVALVSVKKSIGGNEGLSVLRALDKLLFTVTLRRINVGGNVFLYMLCQFCFDTWNRKVGFFS